MLALALGLSCVAASSRVAPASPWQLVWSDEFQGPLGAGPDPAKWVFDLGGEGWGNQELEAYTDSRANARIQDGCLVLEARREPWQGPDGLLRDFTSARLKTEGRFSFRYGRVEARIQLPAGKGIWPAFWMLGDRDGERKWPDTGEIDIMENLGQDPATVHGSVHGPGGARTWSLSAAFHLGPGQSFSRSFHVFALEWEPDALRFYVDDALYQTRTRADLPADGRWVFDHPFHLLLDLAVGGDWPGAPDAETRFPQQMKVAYVRVYSR